jgi:hypothetical protein
LNKEFDEEIKSRAYAPLLSYIFKETPPAPMVEAPALEPVAALEPVTPLDKFVGLTKFTVPPVVKEAIEFV